MTTTPDIAEARRLAGALLQWPEPNRRHAADMLRALADELERLRAQVARTPWRVMSDGEKRALIGGYFDPERDREAAMHLINHFERVAAPAQQAPDNNSLGKAGCFPAAEKTNPPLTVGERSRPRLTDEQIAGCATTIKPYPMELVCVPAEQIVSFVRNVEAALAAQPAAQAEPVAHISGVARRKVADLVAQGYRVCGYTMERDGDRSAVVFDAAVRWLTDEQRHALMFVEGSVISNPPAQDKEKQ